jgi:hypothetical protein
MSAFGGKADGFCGNADGAMVSEIFAALKTHWGKQWGKQSKGRNGLAHHYSAGLQSGRAVRGIGAWPRK